MNNDIILFITLSLLAVLAIAFFVVKRLGKGKVKRESTAADDLQLEEKLDRDQYRIIKKIVLPMEDGRVIIGPLLISMYGIFLVDRLRYGGDIQTDNDAATWSATKRRRKKEFPNPLHQNYQYVLLLQDELDVEFSKLRLVIVFDDKSNFITGAPPNVITVDALINYIKSYSYQIINEREVRNIEKKIKTSIKFTAFSSASTQNMEEGKEKKTKDLDKYVQTALGAKAKQDSLGRRILKNPFTRIVFSAIIIAGLGLLSVILYNQYAKKSGEMPGQQMNSALSQEANQEEKGTGIFGFFGISNPAERSVDAKQQAREVVEAANRRTRQMNELNSHLPPPPRGAKGITPSSGGNQAQSRQVQALYSWTNKKGQRVYSTKGFPSDEREYTDAKVEWR